jgi:methylthioribose-1-phosphate isomerase
MKKCIVMLCMMSSIAHATGTGTDLVNALSQCAAYIKQVATKFETWKAENTLTREMLTEAVAASNDVSKKHADIIQQYEKVLPTTYQSESIFTPDQAHEIARLFGEIDQDRDSIVQSQSLIMQRLRPQPLPPETMHMDNLR